LFGAAGGVGADESAVRYAAHASAGCVSSVAGGGNCGQGAASAMFGKFTTNSISGLGGDGTAAIIARGVATAIAGGVGSVIAGGKFENGAVTGAFGYLFNELLHSGPGAMQRSGYETRDAASNKKIWSLDPEGTDPSIKLDVVTAFNNAEANGDGPLRIGQGYRTNAEQDALYAQGRTTPGPIVTWARGGESIHNVGHAIDIFRIDGGNLYNVSPATVNSFKQQGFTWGGDWKAPKTDKPHFQR
jgi:hypothetical protein